MRSFTVRLILFLAVCSFLAPLAHGDDSAVFDTGKNVYPINNDNIRMVSEKVTIIRKRISQVYQETSYMVDGAGFDCEFIFENITDEVQVVKVGFPGITCRTKELNCFQGLNEFVSYVDGGEVLVTIKKEIIDKYDYYKIDKDGKRVPEERYAKRNWYTWDVTFPPHSKLNLRNTYEAVLWSDAIGHSWFDYVLVTGDNWNGTIGSADIEVIYEDENYIRERVGRIEPEGFEIKGNKVEWKLEDFTPKENIHILEISDNVVMGYYLVDFAAYYSSNKYMGAERIYTLDDMVNPIAIHNEWLPQRGYPLISRDVVGEYIDRFYVQSLKDEIYYRHGKKIETMVSYMVFGGFLEGTDLDRVTWHKENPDYSDDLLNDIEKQNIKFIEDYERERGWL